MSGMCGTYILRNRQCGALAVRNGVDHFPTAIHKVAAGKEFRIALDSSEQFAVSRLPDGGNYQIAGDGKRFAGLDANAFKPDELAVFRDDTRGPYLPAEFHSFLFGV